MKTFIRTFFISITVTACVTLLFLGLVYSYEAINKTAYADYKKAVEITDDEIRIFDFTIKK